MTRAWLCRVDPLALVAAVLPATILVLFSRGVAVPACFLGLGFGLLVASGAPWRRIAAVVAGAAAMVTLLTLALRPWISADRVEGEPWAIALAAGLRVITMMVLTLLVALSGHSGRDLVRSLVTNLRLPYRWGYAGLSGARLFPAVAAELELVRSARAVRGSAHRGRPWSPVQRFLEPVVPLLASQIRHAERQALVLESRGFGAYPMRTERAGRPWSVTDSLAVLIIWAITVVPFVVR